MGPRRRPLTVLLARPATRLQAPATRSEKPQQAGREHVAWHRRCAQTQQNALQRVAHACDPMDRGCLRLLR